ncbi:MAG: hypothetical protein ACREN2_11735 [Candidatus Dormibacteria bacterium]
MTENKVIKFPPGTVVSTGEYRNVDTGAVHFFDGQTPLPGSPNSASWQQVSDHFHAHEGHASASHASPDAPSHSVRFTPGTVVSPGEYRNVETGAVHYFDGQKPIPGSANSASWQQVSDHFHAHEGQAAASHASPDAPSHSVRFAPGTMVSPGEYRNVETGAVHYFDGTTPLPGGVNAASWQQVSDHFHAHKS